MIVTVPDRGTFKVVWSHPFVARPGKHHGVAVHRATVCQVLRFTEDPALPGQQFTDEVYVGVGEAHCAPQDIFCKERGRKISLTRALKEAFPEHKDKPARRQIWGAYLNRDRLNRRRPKP